MLYVPYQPSRHAALPPLEPQKDLPPIFLKYWFVSGIGATICTRQTIQGFPVCGISAKCYLLEVPAKPIQNMLLEACFEAGLLRPN